MNDFLADQLLFDSLGFYWNRSIIPKDVPRHDVRRVCFRVHKMMAQFVWDAAVAEGRPFTYPQVQTVIDGAPVRGKRDADIARVSELAVSTKELIRLVEGGEFRSDLSTFLTLAGSEDKVRLDSRFAQDLDAGSFKGIPNPVEKALVLFLCGALRQSSHPCNEGSTSALRLMMNGVLMSNGIDAISVPASCAQKFNTKIAQFYLDRNAAPVMSLLLECHPDFKP